MLLQFFVVYLPLLMSGTLFSGGNERDRILLCWFTCTVSCFPAKVAYEILMLCLWLQVHHGGAGTTAAGLKAAVTRYSWICFCSISELYYSISFSSSWGWLVDCFTQCPTTIVPFFGDQPFWGERVHAKGIGPSPIPIEEFCLEKLVAAIRFMQNPKVIMFRASLLFHLLTNNFIYFISMCKCSRHPLNCLLDVRVGMVDRRAGSVQMNLAKCV